MKISYLSIGLLALVSPLTAAWSKEDREIFRIRDEIAAHETNPGATFYDILGITPSASQDDITKAYRKRSRSLHPDKVKQKLRADRAKDKKNSKKTGAGVHISKPPTSSEIKAAVKKASDDQARLSIITNILRGSGRERYDYFLSNGFPLWKGTDYYYNRYRPGLGTVLIGLFLVVGGGVHYYVLFMSYKRQREFVERYIKFARDAAWGGGLGIPGVDAAPAPAPAPVVDDDDEGPPQPVNRRQRRMYERATRKEEGKPKPKQARKAKSSETSSRDASTGPDGPSGARKRVVAENGKILVVDSLGDVYLEEEDEDGNVNEFLLDPNELAQPTFKDTAVVRAPIWLYNLTIAPFISKKTPDLHIEIPAADDDDSDVPQRTPSTDSAAEDFEILDKSTDSLSKAKSSGAQQGGKLNKRKGRKR
ncbi:Fc.00g061860.m01.CDS01 [Cosmosporella sp. VM-42]